MNNEPKNATYNTPEIIELGDVLDLTMGASQEDADNLVQGYKKSRGSAIEAEPNLE